MPIVKALRINLQKTEPEIQDWDDYYNDFSVVFTINILFSSVFAGIVATISEFLVLLLYNLTSALSVR